MSKVSVFLPAAKSRLTVSLTYLQMKHSMKGGCSCQKLSHPEIDKLRTEVKDLVSLPMISALCNDKELQRSANLACSCGSTDTMEPPASPRPISWHCEVPQAFSFPISSSHRTGQTCHWWHNSESNHCSTYMNDSPISNVLLYSNVKKFFILILQSIRPIVLPNVIYRHKFSGFPKPFELSNYQSIYHCSRNPQSRKQYCEAISSL